MKILLHDLSPQAFETIVGDGPEAGRILSDQGQIRPCIGCFGCWIKTPGSCVLKDDFQHMGEWLARCEELLIISQCVYGSYSPFIKNVLDRSISYLLPYFTIRRGETHHQNRYPTRFKLTAHFYGENMSPGEQETARALVQANGINFDALESRVFFHAGPMAIKSS